MEETQAIDFDDLPADEEPVQANIHQVAGELQMVSQPTDRLPLYLGLNVVGRGSSQADQEVMLNKWQADFSGLPVHGVFLHNNSISATHAVIYLESAGAVCWIKDLGSRNKTMLGRAGGLTVLQSKGDRYSVLPGDKLKFGTVETTVSYSTTYRQASTGGGVQPGSHHGNSSHATEAQRNVSRSPTPDMASAQPPSGPPATTDNDMTLPWDDPLDDQPDLYPKGSSGHRGTAAVNIDTQMPAPSNDPEQSMTGATILPETQPNLPTDLAAGTGVGFHKPPSGPQDTTFAEPTQLVSASTHLIGEPTQLLGEPTQLALPAHPVATALPGTQGGTALASAAAQAMTGAPPSQASALPSSGGFPTAMPSLAQPQPASQTPAASALAHKSGPEQVTDSLLPISRPEADAVLHLPSQPSGSQHAAHPHGLSKTHGAAASAASAPAQKPGSRVSQLQQHSGPGEQRHQEDTQQRLTASQEIQRDSAVAGAGSSDHNTLLDSVLGHDDDDSVWMPPAFLPESEGRKEGAEPASLASEEGQDMPLQLQVPTAGAAEGAAPVPQAAQQASDSDQTQDSQSETIQDSQQDADAAVGSSGPPAAKGPTNHGSTGRALPHAEEGMYTGAFAFPDSASLEVSQPAMDLPHKSGKGQRSTAARAAAPGKTAKVAAAAAGKEAAPTVELARAAWAEDNPSSTSVSSGASPKGRVMPSGWKKKKADPAADGPAGSSAEKGENAAAASAAPPAGAVQDQVPHAAAQPEKAAPGTTHFVHGTGKPSPWRVRGTPLGVAPGPGPSQVPNSEDINAAMAAAGDLAAFFPSTQAEPQVDAPNGSTVGPFSGPATAAVAAAQTSNSAAAAAAEKSNPAAAAAEESNPAAAAAEESNPAAAAEKSNPAAATLVDQNGAQAVPDHAALAQQPSSATDMAHVHHPKAASGSGGTSVEGEAEEGGVAAGADSRSADKASHAQPGEAEDVQTRKATSPRQASRRKQSGRAAVEEEEQEDQGAAGGRGRGKRGSGARGKGQGRGRGRKRSSPDTGDDATKVEHPQVTAAKGKQGGSKGREASPALQPTRVSKRQKAKAEAQAADTAQEEEEQTPDEDPFIGAATQAAAGILEDLRRSATPDLDADVDEPAGAAHPALQPTMKGKRSSTKRTARAAPAPQSEAAAAAAEAPAQGPAVADDQSSGKGARPKRRAPAQSKATAASEGSEGTATLPGQDSAGHSAASASTAAHSNGHDSPAAGASEEQEEGSKLVKRGQKRQAGSSSQAQGRRKSRLSKASSSAQDPTSVVDPAAEALLQQPGPARRGSVKQPHADQAQGNDDRVTTVPKRNSGTGSTAVKAQDAVAIETAPEQAEEAAGKGSPQNAAEDAQTSKSLSVRGKAKRKSVPTTVDEEQPPAPAGGGRRGSRGGQPAPKQAANAAHVASAAASAADECRDTAPASKAKQDSRVKGTTARSQSQAAAAEEEAKPSGGRRRSSQGKASTARATSQSEAAAAEDDREEEAGPSVQPGGEDVTTEKGAQAKGKAVTGKRSRQSMEDAADAGPAGHVKAARKATDSKSVRVLYSTSLDKSKKSSMSKIIKRLGGSVEDAEGPDFTHFVALQPTAANQTDRGFKKSINALIALAAGRPIVSETWVEACGRSGSFVDPLDHLLIDKAAQKRFGFDMRTSYERAQHQLLLAGLHVFFTPGALAGEHDGGTNIKNLVEHAGGVVDMQLPSSVSDKDPEVLSQWLLIGGEDDKDKDHKLCRKQYAAGLAFHGRSMLIDSIMQQCLDKKHGILFTT